MPDLTNQQLLDIIRQEFATKNDLEQFVTKQDLAKFATKQDLERFATKDDLTHSIARLERKLDSHKETSVQQHLSILKEVGRLNQQYIQVSERQDVLDLRFSRLRIVSD